MAVLFLPPLASSELISGDFLWQDGTFLKVFLLF
jgi:hypothetical protein